VLSCRCEAQSTEAISGSNSELASLRSQFIMQIHISTTEHENDTGVRHGESDARLPQSVSPPLAGGDQEEGDITLT
jgi:hypothetical protein